MEQEEMIKEFKTRHRCIMDALVLGGLSPAEVAVKFGITESRLSTLRRSPLWEAEEIKLRKEHLQNYQYRLTTLVPKAIAALEDVVCETKVYKVDGETTKIVINNPKDRITAAKEILAQAGLASVVKIEAEIKESSTLNPIVSEVLKKYMVDLTGDEDAEEAGEMCAEGEGTGDEEVQRMGNLH